MHKPNEDVQCTEELHIDWHIKQIMTSINHLEELKKFNECCSEKIDEHIEKIHKQFINLTNNNYETS